MLGTSASNDAQRDATPTESVRNIWANKFTDTGKGDDTDGATNTADAKNGKKTKVTESTSAWEEIDDDILIHSVKNTVIEIDDGSNSSHSADSRNSSTTVEPAVHHSTNEPKPHISIKRELLDDLGEEDDAIVMIDDEFDDTLNESLDILTDNSVIDELFGTDTLMADFNNINNVVMSDPENVGNRDREIVTCPICEDRMARSELSSHLDGCNGITVKIDPRKRGTKTKALPFYKSQTKPSTSKSKINSAEADLLRRAGYSQDAIDRLGVETEEAKAYNDRIMDELARDERQRRTTSVIQERPTDDNNIETITLDGESSNSSSIPELHPCPVCNVPVDVNQINQHLDVCLQ